MFQQAAIRLLIDSLFAKYSLIYFDKIIQLVVIYLIIFYYSFMRPSHVSNLTYDLYIEIGQNIT